MASLAVEMQNVGSMSRRTPFAESGAATKQMTIEEKGITFDAGTQAGGTLGIITAASWTERRRLKRQYLSAVEAASLIVNKMIGTGIFTTPGAVLALTQDKRLALGLWIAGAFYAALW